jgi:hypothetical protein
MGTVEKVALAIVTVAFVTTLILPERQTAKVIHATGSVFTQSLRTAMGR